MEKFIGEFNLTNVLIIILLIAWGYNMISTAMQNGRKATERFKEPFNRIDDSICDIRTKCDMHVKSLDDRIEDIERRLNEHETAIRDIHTGQSYICRGVQALLDHELHNGNEEEMKAASEGISKWLRTR